jgi:hypothetical protein
MFPARSPAEVPCTGEPVEIGYEADTLPEDDPMHPWGRTQIGSVSTWVSGGLLVIEAPGDGDELIYTRGEADLANAAAYSIESRLRFTVLHEWSGGGSLSIRDGAKQASLHFIQGSDPFVRFELGVEPSPEWPLDLTQPHTFRIDVIRDEAALVFVDGAQVLEAAYRDLREAPPGQAELGLTFFGGAHSTSHWDWVRYEACPAESNNPPIANAGPDLRAVVGDSVYLDSTASVDPDGDALIFRWTQLSGPRVGLDDPTSASPAFVAPPPAEDESMVFSLTVGDGRAFSQPDEVSILLRSHREGIPIPLYDQQVFTIVGELPGAGLVPNKGWYTRKLLDTLGEPDGDKRRGLADISRKLFISKSQDPSIASIHRPESLVYLSRVLLDSFDQLQESYRSHIRLLACDKDFSGFLPGSQPARYSLLVDVKAPRAGVNSSPALRLAASVIDLDTLDIVKQLESIVPLADPGERGNTWRRETLDLVWDGSLDRGGLAARADYAIVGAVELIEIDQGSQGLVRVFDQAPIFGRVFLGDDWGDLVPYGSLVTSINLYKAYNRQSQWLQHDASGGVFAGEIGNPLDRSNATFTVRAGLAGAQGGYVSFESRNLPGRFLRRIGSSFLLSKKPAQESPTYPTFAGDASFLMEPIDPDVFDYTVADPESKFWIRNYSRPDSYLVPQGENGLGVQPVEHDQSYYFSFPMSLELRPFERLGV